MARFKAREPKKGGFMTIATLPAAWAAMTVEELEDALLDAVTKATEADSNEDNAMLVLIDEYFAICLEPEDVAARRRDLAVLLANLLEVQSPGGYQQCEELTSLLGRAR